MDESERRPGRRPGRKPTELELKHARLLLEIRERARRYVTLYDEQLEDFVVELRDSGCSARSIAAALKVSSSAVQIWTKHARQRR